LLDRRDAEKDRYIERLEKQVDALSGVARGATSAAEKATDTAKHVVDDAVTDELRLMRIQIAAIDKAVRNRNAEDV
jgi:hypothetical protein